jgi:transposase
MVNKRAYKRVSVNDIDRNQLLEAALTGGKTGTVLGLDIAKNEIVGCVRWGTGQFERPWKIVNPKGILTLIELCQLLKSKCDGFSVALESTGTYGDAARYALSQATISVQRISGKAVSDYKEIFDKVPSQHDGKDAAMIAELAAFGKGTLWPYTALSEIQQRINHQVRRIGALRTQQTQWTGRLEALVAKHWPELTSELKLGSVTLLKLFETYGSPARALADPRLALNLAMWGRSPMTQEKVSGVIESAKTTMGLPMGEPDADWVKEVACETLKALREVRTCDRKLRELIANDDVMARYSDAAGASTLAVIWSKIGDPIEYSSSGAFVKAIGLNLKEISSGKRKGELGISKRGPAQARRWIYYWAMRAVQRPEFAKWYEEFIRVGSVRSKSTGEHRKMKALIALMRKLCKSLWHVRKHEKEFDYTKVIESIPEPSSKRRRKRKGSNKQTLGPAPNPGI